MDRKAWQKLQEQIKELALEEQIAELRSHVKKITEKEFRKEIESQIQQREQQLQTVQSARDRLQAEILARQEQARPSPLEQTPTEQQRAAQESLEEVVGTTATNQQANATQNNQKDLRGLQYLPNMQYTTPQAYTRETPYAMRQEKTAKEGFMEMHLQPEQKSLRERREQEQQEQQAHMAASPLAEQGEFTEYRSKRQQKKFLT